MAAHRPSANGVMRGGDEQRGVIDEMLHLLYDLKEEEYV